MEKCDFIGEFEGGANAGGNEGLFECGMRNSGIRDLLGRDDRDDQGI